MAIDPDFIPDPDFVPDPVPGAAPVAMADPDFIPDPPAEQGILDQAKAAGMWAITPIAGASEFKQGVADLAGETMAAAQPAVLAPPASASPVDQAFAAVRSSLVPVPSPETARGIVEFAVPIAPLDIAGTAVPGVAGAIAGRVRGQLGKTAQRIAAAAPEVPESVVLPPPPPPPPAPVRSPVNALGLRKQELARALNAQRQELQQFAGRQQGHISQGAHREVESRLAGIKATEAELAKIEQELVAAQQAAPSPAVAAPEPAAAAPKRLTLEAAVQEPRQTAVAALEVAREADPMAGMRSITKGTTATVDTAIEKMRAGKQISIEEGQQAADALAEAVLNREIEPELAAHLFGVEVKAGRINEVEMARKLRESATLYGKGLSQYSRFAAEVSKRMGPEAAAILGKVDEPASGWTSAMDLYKPADNVRKAAMVMQPVSTIRNIVTQGAMVGTHTIVDAMNGALGKLTGKTDAALSDALIRVTSAYRASTKAGRADIQNLIARFPVQHARLLRSPMGEVMIDQRVAALLNTLNTTQERYFRMAAFDAHIRQTAMRRGIDLAKDASLLTGKEVEAAVRHALEMTFQASPRSAAGRAFLQLYDAVPILSAVGNPFPRFWLNALRATWELSPAPLFAPSTYRAMAHADPRVAFNAFNKAMAGSTFTAAAYALDQMGLTGEKWYEIKVGNKVYDARPFAPFSAHLFIGRMLSRAQKEGKEAFLKLGTQDWSQALISMRRTDMAGIPLADALQASDSLRGVDRFADATIRIVGNWIGGFTVPGRVAQDVIGQFNKAERTPRSVQERPLIGPAIANIPFLQRALPERPSPLRKSGPEERINPGLRQLTGVTVRQKTPAETEADNIGLKPADIYPRTGSKEFDRLIAEQMGPLVEDALEGLIQNPEYQEGTPPFKRFLFGGIIDNARKAAKAMTSGQRPDLMIEQFKKNADEFMREHLKEVSAPEPEEEPAPLPVDDDEDDE